MKMNEVNRSLERCIADLNIGNDILELLLPKGKPHAFETDFWDYKEIFPAQPSPPSSGNMKLYNYELHKIIKDVVSFYNSYGGYLIFGVKDKGLDKLCNFETEVDCDDFIKRIKAYTGESIQIYFARLDAPHPHSEKTIGLLLIPRRKQSDSPVCMIKNGPTWEEKKPYNKGSTYIRREAQCIAAENSDKDWSFLYSERRLEPKNTLVKLLASSNLPPRDQELVEFVGRNKELGILRSWSLDQKAPIKLLTGIGGLGKTSIAYRFAEEVCETTAGGVEAVIWLTAKKETFAALRGKMVSTTRHDFSNIKELLERLVKEFWGEFVFEQDTDIDELKELVIEGCEEQPCLMIIDDLDSLSPEDQKECTSILQEISQRTVGRKYLPSKILLTARLDQGMSPTSVIKVSGLNKEPFIHHLKNLCKQFGLAEFSPTVNKQIFKTTSGSPLFASGIVRLVNLGENPKKVCDTWMDGDGEDIRAFAFKRELDRLSVQAASVFLAVLRMGEVGLDDLEAIVEVNKRRLLDLISELQSYHLLSKSENKFGEMNFAASKELLAVVDILRQRLGKNTHSIERNCAKVKKNQGDQSAGIGTGISRIVSLWNEGSSEEALLRAKELARVHPTNGDVLCALGKALLVVSPARYKEADLALNQSVQFKCKRIELFSLVVRVKKGLEDWQGLRTYALTNSSKNPAYDPTLDALITANSNLYNLAMNSERLDDAIKYSKEVVEKISDKIQGQSLKHSYFENLCERQLISARDYINAVRQRNTRDGDHIDIVNAVFVLNENKISNAEYSTLACYALKKWFSSVENRPVVDLEALEILQDKLIVLKRYKNSFGSKLSGNESFLIELDSTITELEFRGAKLSAL